ncbi:MAG: EAL domain-containing protein [Gammaproteobacteria bacterium]|nr:EAL domain-containing protein [Gammaproteobacteria bacterium]NND58677.1 REC domain-containing phosphodiesterase [Gammaproteobacteria bacterium]
MLNSEFGNESGAPQQRQQRRALLVCRDAASAKWGPRWLEQSGFETDCCESAVDAFELAVSRHPDVVIVESSIRDTGGRLLYRTLQHCGKDRLLPVIVLCGSKTDLQSALDHEAVTEVVRKPFDWQLISRRAIQISEHNGNDEELRSLRTALESAQIDVSQLRQDLAERSDTDALTRLLNRARFRQALEQTLAGTNVGTTGLGVMVVRLNSFRAVNDALGYENGNLVLQEAAKRLGDSIGQRPGGGDRVLTASMGRLGGISFGIAITGLNGGEQLAPLAESLLQNLNRPVEIAGQTLYLSASVGGAAYPCDGEHADLLLHHAEGAALTARQRGGGFQLYRQPLGDFSARFLRLDSMLHEALEQRQLHVEYQPILDVAESRVVGAEALLRWNHPEEGLISPAEFVPVAEKTGLMPQIGALVIDDACRQLHNWLAAGVGHIRVAVNLSLAQLQHDDVVDVVGAAISKWKIPATLLELELSERGVVGRDAEVLRQLHMLKSLGVRLAIDDFGTGDASIAYLKDLPIDALKIDRSYVSESGVSERDATIAAGMAALARRLGLTVIAEGVESAAQLALLRDWGCHQYQGFYFSPSVAANRFLPLAERANQRLTAAEGHVADLF